MITPALLSELTRYAERYATRASVSAEDVVQRSIERWLASSYEERGQLRAYLFRCVRNEAVNEYRRLQIELEALGQVPTDGHTDPVEPQRFDPVELLDEPFGTAARLYADGHTYKEIAELTNIPVGTVMSRLYRARHKLAELLWDDDEVGHCVPGRYR